MSMLPAVQLRRPKSSGKKAERPRKNCDEKRIRLIQNARGAVSAKLRTIYCA